MNFENFDIKSVILSKNVSNNIKKVSDNNETEYCDDEEDDEDFVTLSKLEIGKKIENKFKHHISASKIINNLYLGSIRDILDINLLKKLQIRNFIQLTPVHHTDIHNSGFNNLIILDFYDKIKISCKINIKDRPESKINEYFDITFEIIEQSLINDETILVFCYMGKSR
jgi:hypothetical protein